MAEFYALEDDFLGDLFGPRFHHDDLVSSADDDEVEQALVHLGHFRVQHEFTVDIADMHGAYRPLEGYLGDGQARAGPDDRKYVRVVFLVGGKDRGDYLYLAVPVLRQERPYRPVGLPAGQDGRLAGAPLPPYKASRYFTGGVKSFLVVDGQGQEVHSLPRLPVEADGYQDDCIAVAYRYCRVRLLCQFACFNE